jgi:hypothetical protein
MPVILNKPTKIDLEDHMLWLSRGLERKVRGRKLKSTEEIRDDGVYVGWKDVLGNIIFFIAFAKLKQMYALAEVEAKFGKDMRDKLLTYAGRKSIFE